jgi:hypothetical protein
VRNPGARRRAGAGRGIAAALALAAFSCGGRGAPARPWQLYRALATSQRLEVAVAPGPAAELCLPAVRRLRSEGPFEVALVDPSAPRGEAPRILVGDETTPGMRAVLERLQVELGAAEGFALLGRRFDEPGAVLVATLEDPERAGLPLTAWFARRAVDAARAAVELEPAWRPSLQVRLGGRALLRARLDPDGRPIEGTREEPAAGADGAPVRTLELEGLRVRVPPDLDPARWAGYAPKLARARAELLAALGPPDGREAPTVELEIEQVLARHVEACGGQSLWSAAPCGARVLLAPELPDDGGAGLAAALALALAGPPAEPWMLDAAAAFGAASWWGRPMDVWVAALAGGGLVPSIEELAAPDAGRSPHLLAPLRGVLFAQLLEDRGRIGLLDLWQGREGLVPDERLRASFEAALAESRLRYGAELERRRAERLARVLGVRFRKGIDLCEARPGEGWDGGGSNGFGSDAAERSLRQARLDGADSVALVFYGSAESSLAELAGTRAGGALAASVRDLELAACAARASRLGFSVALRPELLGSRSGTWRAALVGSTSRSLEEFFADYRSFLVHCALLAELCGAELVCIGGGLLEVTSSAPSGALTAGPGLERREGWRGLIRSARGAFSGALTYAAGGVEEAQAIEFWPELDWLGIDLFGSLAVPPRWGVRPMSDRLPARIWAELTRALDLAAAQRKRLLVTAIGFAASEEAWRRPEERFGKPDVLEQARLYAGLSQVVRALARDRSELAGVFVWNWLTEPAMSGAFTPQGRPAEGELEALFERL